MKKVISIAKILCNYKNTYIYQTKKKVLNERISIGGNV